MDPQLLKRKGSILNVATIVMWALLLAGGIGLLVMLPGVPIQSHALYLLVGGLVMCVPVYLLTKQSRWSHPLWNLWLFVFAATMLFATNSIGVGKVQIPRALFAVVVMLLLIRGFYYGIVKREKMKGWVKNVSLLLVAPLLLFLIAETVCMFIAYPIGSAASLSSELWYARYWKPINSMGYRDAEYSLGDKREKVLVLGDSYAAGQGIENAGDRFPDLIREGLPPQWTLVNLSQPGATTQMEWEALQTFPDSADFIILSYLTNDIESAAAKAGHHFEPVDLRDWNPVPRFFMLNSYCINFIYALTPLRHDYGYGDYLKEINGDPVVWQTHFAELKQFTDAAKQRNIPLLVLLWPNLREPSFSREHLDKVGGFMDAEGALVLDLSSVAESLPVEQRVVNHVDAHPGEEMHKKVAEVVLVSVLGVGSVR